MTNTTTDVPKQPTDNRRGVIHASCSVQAAARGFTNLVVVKRAGEILLGLYPDGSWVLTLVDVVSTENRPHQSGSAGGWT